MDWIGLDWMERLIVRSSQRNGEMEERTNERIIELLHERTNDHENMSKSMTDKENQRIG